MIKYVLISKCHLQARAKQLEKIFLWLSMSLFQNVIYRRARNSLKHMFSWLSMSLFQYCFFTSCFLFRPNSAPPRLLLGSTSAPPRLLFEILPWYTFRGHLQVFLLRQQMGTRHINIENDWGLVNLFRFSSCVAKISKNKRREGGGV